MAARLAQGRVDGRASLGVRQPRSSRRASTRNFTTSFQPQNAAPNSGVCPGPLPRAPPVVATFESAPASSSTASASIELLLDVGGHVLRDPGAVAADVAFERAVARRRHHRRDAVWFGRSSRAPCAIRSFIESASKVFAARSSGVAPVSASSRSRDPRRARGTAAASLSCRFGFAPFSRIVLHESQPGGLVRRRRVRAAAGRQRVHVDRHVERRAAPPVPNVELAPACTR